MSDLRTRAVDGSELPVARGTVGVVVVTYNRRALLERCLTALKSQIGPGDCVLVIDNASTDGTGEMLRSFEGIELIELEENVGGAGGFHAGMRHAHEAGFDWLWLMDDDGVPEPGCLDALLQNADRTSVRVPVQRDSGDRFYGICAWRGRPVDITNEILAGALPARGHYLFSFVGPLIPRAAVDRVGLPRAEYFIWFDDYEYGLRLMNETSISVELVPDAVFRHDMGENARPVRFLGIKSVRSDVAPWKLYYGARNQLYTLLSARRPPKEILLFAAVQARLLLMDARFGPERARRIGLRLRGLWDGARGRFGKI